MIAVIVIDITKFHIFHPLRHHHQHPNDSDRHERPGNRKAGRCDGCRVCVGQGQAVPKYGGHDDDVDDDDHCFCVGQCHDADSEDDKGDGQDEMIMTIFVALIIIVVAGDS